MIEDSKAGKTHRTGDSLTSEHLSKALTLTTEHLNERLTAESMTTSHIVLAMGSVAKGQSNSQDNDQREIKSSK